MPRAIGAKAKLRTRPESTYGTAPSGNWTQLPFKSFELGASQELLDDPVLGAGDRRTTGDPALDTVTVEGSAVVPVDLVNFGHWLRLLLGPPTTTGTGPDYVHSFKDGAYGLPSNAFELDFVDPLPNRYSLLTGVKANELQLDFSPTGPADATIALLGPRVFLSVPRTPVSGPQGVEISVDFRAADDSTAACLMQVVLKNQVASYA